MKTSFIIGLLTTSCLFFAAQESPKPSGGYYTSALDGEHWAQMSRDIKISYVVGFQDASETYWVFFRELSKTGPEAQSQVEKLEQNMPPFAKSSAAQVVEGVDKFYADYRNRHIHPVWALKIVAMELGGRPESEIETSVRKLREESRQ